MAVQIKYLGILAESAGKHGESLDYTGPLKTLIGNLNEQYPDLASLNFVSSHNGKIVHGDVELVDGDEVCLIPPMPGG